MQKEELAKKVAYLALLAILFYISYLMIKPFISAILASVFLAFLFYPFYIRLNNIIKNPTISATLIILIIVIIIIGPLILVAQIQESITAFTEATFLRDIIPSIIERGLTYITSNASNFLISIPEKIFVFIVTIYSTFYLILAGDTFKKKIKAFLPFKNKEHIISNIIITTKSIIYGTFIIAVIEAILTIIGFYILGISSPWVWGVIIAFLALIPYLGPAIVWIPYSIILALQGDINIAIGMIILGLILSSIDTFLRPKIINQRAAIHPVIIFIGIIGGIQIMGIVGLLVGPLILSTALILIETHFQDEIES